MAEYLTNVYDINHPSPPPLKQLVLISVGLELKRHEIGQHRATNSLNTLSLGSRISPSTLQSLMPSTIFNDIEKYTGNIGESINSWLEYSCTSLLDFHRKDPNEILRDFDDFVCDFDCKIHSSRTAKRMMLSDRFSIEEKFVIACANCFEEDVLRIWPSVSSKINLDKINFYTDRVLYYWICLLSNQLEKIPGFDSGSDETVEEIMLKNMREFDWVIVEYFLNRLNPDNRWPSISSLAQKNHWKFSRYMLAKLNEQELDKYMTEKGNELLQILLKYPIDLLCILPTWKLIKNKLNMDGFLNIAREIFRQEADCNLQLWDESVSWEIWKDTPDNVKQQVIREVLPDSSLFVRGDRSMAEFRRLSFLLAVLTDVPFEERRDFWNKNWSDLSFECKTNDLSSLMSLCFNDETVIIQFKESTLSKYENIRPQCSKLLKDASFQELKKFVRFCCLSEQASRDVMRILLNNDLELNFLQMSKAELFEDFIKDAFNDDDDQIRNFKIELSSSLDKNTGLRMAILCGQLKILMNFIDKFVVSKKKAVYLKNRYFPDTLKDFLEDGNVPIVEDDDLSQFVHWCFENNERDVAKFKATLNWVEIVQKIFQRDVSNARESLARDLRRRKHPPKLSHRLDTFLGWYFGNTYSESVEKLKKQSAEVFESLVYQS